MPLNVELAPMTVALDETDPMDVSLGFFWNLWSTLSSFVILSPSLYILAALC